MGLTRRPTQRTKIRHTQTKPADGVDEPPQVRTLSVKRAGKATGRRSKRLDRRLPHHHNIAAVKSARKRIGKVIRKGHQAIAGPYNPQQRQRCRHMRRRKQPRLTRAGPKSPGLF